MGKSSSRPWNVGGGEEHAGVLDAGDRLGDRVADAEPFRHAFGVRAGRRGLRVGDSDRRVHARDHAELLELTPERLEVVTFDVGAAVEHRPQRRGAEALGRDAVELALRERQALQRQHRDRVESPVARSREVGDPVVVRAREHVGGDGVFDERVVLEKQRRVHDRVVDPERVHVGEPGARVARAGIDRVRSRRVERADVVEGHARAPDGLAVDRAAVHLLRGPSVEHGEATTASSSKCQSAERASPSKPDGTYESHSAAGSKTWLSLSTTGNVCSATQNPRHVSKSITLVRTLLHTAHNFASTSRGRRTTRVRAVRGRASARARRRRCRHRSATSTSVSGALVRSP